LISSTYCTIRSGNESTIHPWFELFWWGKRGSLCKKTYRRGEGREEDVRKMWEKDMGKTWGRRGKGYGENVGKTWGRRGKGYGKIWGRCREN